MPWDQILVYLIVAGAAAYLLWRQRRKKPGCGDCPSACHTPRSAPGRGSSSGDELVQIDARPRPRARPRARR